MGDKMVFSKILHKRRFSMFSGFMVGLIFLFLIHVSGLNPAKYLGIFNTSNFFIPSNLMTFSIFMIPVSIAIISAGIVTFALLSEKKKHCIFGGITGMWLILISMGFSYSVGLMQFPITSQVEFILGTPGIALVFLIYAVPITMLGFILGYFGSFVTEKFSYKEKSI